jgi:hypothetical protein
MNSAHILPDGSFVLHLPAGRNYLAMYFGPKWRGVNTDRLLEKGIEIEDGRTVDLEIRVKPRIPGDDEPPKPLAPAQAAELAEQAAKAAIMQLGGWVATENFDGRDQVVEVNMVYHEDEEQGRQNNRLISDECLSYVRKFPKLKRLLLFREQATDATLANLRGMENVERVMIWDAAAVTDAGAAHIAALPKLKVVHLSNSQITDEALRHFSRAPKIEELSLQGNHFTDNGLAYVKDMTQLKALVIGLGRNEITDGGLGHLVRLTNLERLDLQRSKVTDAGLEHLRGLKKLQTVWLSGTAVTTAGIDELRKSLPNWRQPEARSD